MADQKLSTSPAALILGLSMRRVDQLANSNILPFEPLTTGQGRIIKIFKLSDVEALRDKRQLSKNIS